MFVPCLNGLHTHYVQALVEIGFTMVEGPDRAGQTLRPPMGVKEAEGDLFIRRPAGEDGWWAYGYIP